MKTNIDKIITISIAILTASLSVSSIVTNAAKPVSFSDNENRLLATWPDCNMSTIKNAEYTSGINSYLTDHFIARDEFMTGYALTQKAFMKKEINNVYLCDDDYLIEAYKEPVKTDKITRKFNLLAKKLSFKPDIILVPTSIVYNSDKLPAYVDSNRQLETYKSYTDKLQYNVIDVREAFAGHSDAFYRTDHHWTTNSAYDAYVLYCKAKGFDAIPKSSFDIKTVSESFYGSVFSKINNVFIKPDTITAYLQPDLDLDVVYNSTQKSNSLYNEEYLDKKDKYSYFLNNQNGIIEIHNNKINNQKRLLVVKDSYANCFIPFLVNHYEDITVLDTRYYRLGVSTYIEANKVTDLLLMYNLNTIDTDTGIAGIF